jgi:hypothetical protein
MRRRGCGIGAAGLITAVIMAAVKDARRGDPEARAWLVECAPAVVFECFGVDEAYTRAQLAARLKG